ncbi:MAG TPA: serine protease [Candidatus Paceibacterota bacterium]|nr:serine protease [Candidatus Paceibacterota bacterium]
MRTDLLAVLAAVAAALFVGYFSTGVSVVRGRAGAPAASTTLAGLAPAPLPSLDLPGLASSTERAGAATSAPAEAAPALPPPAAGAPRPTVAAPEPALPAGDLSAASDILRPALVNILCISPAGSGLESISGSGVLITNSGIILTNAHIGQYFLLADKGVSCAIRTGSPATTRYRAAPIFVSPAWLSANPNVLVESAPVGTGEHDFALLAIDATVDGSPLPGVFPFVPLAQDPPVLGEPVVIGSYAAQFLKASEVENALSATLVYGSVANVYTFSASSVDVVSLGGSAAAQEGSSGGGAVDASGELAATITTSTTEGNTASRELNAITASYIRRDYSAQVGAPLGALLAAPVESDIESFAAQIPALEAKLTLPR